MIRRIPIPRGLWVLPLILWSASFIVPTIGDWDWLYGIWATMSSLMVAIGGFFEDPRFILGIWPNLLVPVGIIFLAREESREAMICGVLACASALFWPLWGAQAVEVELGPFLGYWLWLGSCVSIVIIGLRMQVQTQKSAVMR